MLKIILFSKTTVVYLFNKTMTFKCMRNYYDKLNYSIQWWIRSMKISDATLLLKECSFLYYICWKLYNSFDYLKLESIIYLS